jgi:hypothetical protein
MEEIKLQEWVKQQTVDDKMSWKEASEEQMRFLFDLQDLVLIDIPREERLNHILVISTHCSKSISLPVVKIERPDHSLTFILRNNFYNWKLSVISKEPVVANFDGLFFTVPPIEPEYTGDPLHRCYFEGFPQEYIFGYYEKSDKKKWSCELHDDSYLQITLFLIMRSLGFIKPNKWHTKESHRKELDAEYKQREEQQNGQR